MVGKFNAKEEDVTEEELLNVSQIICELITKKSQVTDYEKFEAYFNSKEFLDIIFDRLFVSENLIKHIIPIIISLLHIHLPVSRE